MPRPSRFTRTSKSGERKVNPGYGRFSAFLPDEMMRDLRVWAAMDGVTVSDILEAALKEYRKRRKS